MLAGLRYPDERIAEVYAAMSLNLEDSSTYQLISRKERARALGATLLRQGTLRFGRPADAVEAAVTSIQELSRLERLLDRVLTAADWNDLLATP